MATLSVARRPRVAGNIWKKDRECFRNCESEKVPDISSSLKLNSPVSTESRLLSGGD